MADRQQNPEVTHVLPDDVRRLIVRKLRQLRHELDLRLVELQVISFHNIETGIAPALREGKVGYAMTVLPLSAYRALAKKIRTEVLGLPPALWEVARTTIESARLDAPVSRSELILLLEDFMGSAQKKTFAHQFLDADRFLGSVRRSFGRRGLNDQQMIARLKESVLHQQALAMVDIGNVARRGREAAEIAIDEFLLSRKPHSKAPVNPKQSARVGSDGKQAPPPRAIDAKYLQERARHAANMRHDAPGGSRDKRKQVVAMWETGEFKTKRRCAEVASRKFKISYETAFKALRTPRDRLV